VQRARDPAEAHASLSGASAERVHLLTGSRPRSPALHLDSEAVLNRLDEAVDGLAARAPELSAATGLPRWQKLSLTALAAIAGGGALLAPEATLVALLAVMAIPFLMVVALRAASLWHLLQGAAPLLCEETEAAAADGPLPLYTVLVPLYHEAAVVGHLLRALARIDYPADRLQIILIVESVDDETQAALADAALDRHVRVLVVPDGTPRTKPRALQYALQFARGDYVVVYDAEDVPEPDQLRRALAVLRAAPERFGCVQAQLNIYNSRSSWLTRQFTIEYTALFDAILPTLAWLKLPVPLGGTSNHFSRAALDAVGGWDPYNVTEDADLGIRLARAGWNVGVLRSTTWEEAPPTFAVWRGQRTRWLKGWMQTYLVHMRQPRRLWRELGARGVLGLQVLMGGLILSALVHPWFYVLVALDLWQGRLLGVPSSPLGQALLWIGVLNVIAGYISAIALGGVSTARRGRLGLSAHAALMPLYWLGISFAAYRALVQLVWQPYYWEKTEHFARAAGAHAAQDRSAETPPIAAE
jgi:cellulose synthase/poly-beta-1,6-N-acetylglucosamine synthase-like glycosyltransferase